jgi:lipopolysaccharide biosynthesis glycosyltransferase
MNIGFATVCTDGYVKLLQVFLHSILKHNPDFKHPFYIFTDKEKLTADNEKALKSVYSNVVFKYPDKQKYINHNKGDIKYFSLESFNLDHDFIIYLGCDVLCLKKLDVLYDLLNTLDKHETFIGMTKEKRRVNTFNNNCMIIPKVFLNKGIYNKLLGYECKDDTIYGTDQKLFYGFFKKNVIEIDQLFNTLVSEAEYIDFNEILFLHYIYKPTNDNTKMLKPYLLKIWKKYEEEFNGKIQKKTNSN